MRALAGAPASAASSASSGDKLKYNSIDFLYQPKIDLKQRALAGVEILPQIRHHKAGLMSPSAFLAQATTSQRQQFSLIAIRAAFSAWRALSQMGFSVKFSVGVPIELVGQQAIIDLLQSERPTEENWPGLMLEIPTSDAMPMLSALREFVDEIRKHNIHLGLSGLQPADVLNPGLQLLPIAEVKLWNAFVMSARNRPLLTNACRALIDFAHACRATASVAGLEQSEGLVWANKLGFDVGQGNLLAAPTTRAGLMAILPRAAG